MPFVKTAVQRQRRFKKRKVFFDHYCRCQLRKRLKEITWININEVAMDVCPNVLRFVDLLNPCLQVVQTVSEVLVSLSSLSQTGGVNYKIKK